MREAAMIEECLLCLRRLHAVQDANISAHAKRSATRRVVTTHRTERHRSRTCTKCGSDFTLTGESRAGRFVEWCFPCLLASHVRAGARAC